jgi:hypothetical protein
MVLLQMRRLGKVIYEEKRKERGGCRKRKKERKK